MVDWLPGQDSRLVTGAGLEEWLAGQAPNPWAELLQEAVEEYALETGDSETPVNSFIEWLAEWGREVRRLQRGLLLLIAHWAKGLEFGHVVVLDGDWACVGKGEDADAPRRLCCVVMTRARQTLALMRLPRPNPFLGVQSDAPSTLFRNGPAAHPAPEPEVARSFCRLSPGDVFISFAGNRRSGHSGHEAIAVPSPGDLLQVRAGSGRWELLDQDGLVVGQLPRNLPPPPGMRCEYATVMAIRRWDQERSNPQFQANLRADSWEAVVPELVFQPDR